MNMITTLFSTIGFNKKKSLQIPPTGPSERSHLSNRGVPGVIAGNELPETAAYNPLIGRKVMTRWPEDNNFYEAVITDYDPQKVCNSVLLLLISYLSLDGIQPLPFSLLIPGASCSCI